MNGVIVPHGDWGYGAMYFGVALLLGEFLDVGKRPMVDRLLAFPETQGIRRARSGVEKTQSRLT
ncbi:hypothetical protein LA345_39635 (plasmid) [Burkholderia vietnamiensis]|nr:hypothetical protein [Burkholderia vietnamiensis]